LPIDETPVEPAANADHTPFQRPDDERLGNVVPSNVVPSNVVPSNVGPAAGDASTDNVPRTGIRIS
jgi:hypothetical protein